MQPEPPLREEEEMESAAELLEASNEEELDHFLNRFLRRGHARRGRRMGGPMTRALGGWIKGAMRRVLPGLGRSGRGFRGRYPNYSGYPGYRNYPAYSNYPGQSNYPSDSGDSDDSADSGDDSYSSYPMDPRFGQLAPGAGQMLGFEMEGLSAEDQEFSAARQLVRLARAAAEQAAEQSETGNPAAAAEKAIAHAAQIYAPGLLRPGPDGHSSCGCGSSGECHCTAAGRTGNWVQRGDRIILHGV